MFWRGAGHHGGKGKRLASELFGGTDFPLENYRFRSCFVRKIGGTENPKGARLRPGSRGAMRGREGSRRRLVADACQGIRRQVDFRW
jgi:hypothetical protein